MTTSNFLRPKDPSETRELIQVALGQAKADLVIVNARLVNVYTGELLDDQAISIKRQWLAYVGGDPQAGIGPRTEVIDAQGKTVIPGLIDGHTHMAGLYRASEFLKFVIPGGTTTIITETMEISPVAGLAGVFDFLASLKDQPIKILGLATALVSISRAAPGITAETLQALLEHDHIIGLGETYWQAVLQEPDRLLPVLAQTLAAGKLLEGHSAGASEKKLAAYVAAGISSCHEPINADQVLSRLRQGLHVMIREGSIRRDLEEIAKIKNQGIDLRRLILVTDGISPADLQAKGYMEFVVQKAIDSGFDPLAAVQMATLNVAEHFGLDGLLGGIAPGRYADLVIIPDIHTIDAQLVISNGRVIAEQGKLLVTPREHTFATQSLHTVHLPQELQPSDFIILPPDDAAQVRVRVIEMVTDLVTAELEMDWPVVDGQLRIDLAPDVLKVAAIDRSRVPGRIYVGLIKGFGLKSGAMAYSAAWDSSDIIVVGADDGDMAASVNRVRSLQGGAVVCENGEILAELPLPVFGIISDLPLDTIARRLEEIKRTVAHLGVPFPDPLLTLATLTGAAIPYLRICEEGLVNLKDGQTRGLFVSHS
ncbi:MAG: adenine deaminase [Desulfobacterales bacterium]|nr:MAG: adenine deaminase [Desulfobacterales bacterium]